MNLPSCVLGEIVFPWAAKALLEICGWLWAAGKKHSSSFTCKVKLLQQLGKKHTRSLTGKVKLLQQLGKKKSCFAAKVRRFTFAISKAIALPRR